MPQPAQVMTGGFALLPQTYQCTRSGNFGFSFNFTCISQFQYFTADVTKTGNGEWGMGNGEWGMGNGEWGMGNGEWGMGNGEWGMGNGEWGMGNGEWGMGNGEWGMGNGEWEMGNGKWEMGNGKWEIENGKWEIENGKLIFFFCFLISLPKAIFVIAQLVGPFSEKL